MTIIIALAVTGGLTLYSFSGTIKPINADNSTSLIYFTPFKLGDRMVNEIMVNSTIISVDTDTQSGTRYVKLADDLVIPTNRTDIQNGQKVFAKVFVLEPVCPPNMFNFYNANKTQITSDVTPLLASGKYRLVNETSQYCINGTKALKVDTWQIVH